MPAMIGLTWGAEDLSARLGARGNREDDGRTWRSPYLLARNLCLITAAAAGVEPIDTVFVNLRDGEGLGQEAREAARDGFTGKMAIHPDQVAPINEAFPRRRPHALRATQPLSPAQGPSPPRPMAARSRTPSRA